jgi:hypothetical protein
MLVYLFADIWVVLAQYAACHVNYIYRGCYDKA